MRVLLLGEDAQEIAEALLESIDRGATAEEIAGSVAYAAALRIAQFNTNNEFSDWDSALHSFTFANAIHQALRWAPSAEVIRGVFDAAMSVYLNRFLNVPAARVPEPTSVGDPEMLLGELFGLFDRQQQVNRAGEVVGEYLSEAVGPTSFSPRSAAFSCARTATSTGWSDGRGGLARVLSTRASTAGIHVLVAGARYLAAHAPTVRSQEQSSRIAERLERGEATFRGILSEL